MWKFTSERLNLDDDAGGEAGGTPASRLRLKTGKARQGESLAPLADNLAWGVQASGDDIVGEAFRSEQHDLRADHIAIRLRILACLSFQCEALFPGENYRKWAFSRHEGAIFLMPSMADLAS